MSLITPHPRSFKEIRALKASFHVVCMWCIGCNWLLFPGLLLLSLDMNTGHLPGIFFCLM